MPEWQQNPKGARSLGRDHVRDAGVPGRRRAISFSFEESVLERRRPPRSSTTARYGLNGTAVGGAITANTTPAVATNPGTCRYGAFDGGERLRRGARQRRARHHDRADRRRVDLHAHDALGAPHDRVEGHELRVITSTRQRRVYWSWNDCERHRALDHDDDAARAEPVVSRRRHVPSRAPSASTSTAPFDGTTNCHRARSPRIRCRSSSARTGTSSPARSTATSTRCACVADALTQAEVQALRNETHPCANSAPVHDHAQRVRHQLRCRDRHRRRRRRDQRHAARELQRGRAARHAERLRHVGRSSRARARSATGRPTTASRPTPGRSGSRKRPSR